MRATTRTEPSCADNGNVFGADPHKHTVTASVLDPRGGVLGTRTFNVSGEGHRAMRAWALQFGPISRWGVEGAAGLGRHTAMFACAALDAGGEMSDPAVAMRHTLAAFARRWLDLHAEIRTHTRHLKTLTQAAAPAMLEAFGVGFDTAAEMLIAAGDNNDRVRNERAFAKLCGVCPIPAGSGRTNGRHRLNRGGNRQANAALYRTVIVRMHWHPETIAYVQRRTAEGLSKKEIIRCLKRYVARELYVLLPATSAENPIALVA